MFKAGRHPMFLMDAASDAALAAARKLVADADAAAGGGNGNGSVVIAGQTYTQEAANELFANRARQAAAAERKKVLDELGLPDTDAVKAKLKAADEAAAAGLSDLEKARKEAADAKKQAEDAQAASKAVQTAAMLTLQKAAVTVAASTAGCDQAELETLWREVRDTPALLAEIKPKPDTDEFEGVKEVVAKVLKAHPRWLGQSTTKINLNSGERGRNDGEVNEEAIVQKKRRSGQYGGL